MATIVRESGWIDSNNNVIVKDGNYQTNWPRNSTLEIQFNRNVVNSIVLATTRSDPDKNCDTSNAWVKVCDRVDGETNTVWLTLRNEHGGGPFGGLGIQFVVYDVN